MEKAPSKEFLQLYTGNQSRLYAFIVSLTGNPKQAADVLQDTNLVLWEKSGEYQPGTNFMAWAFRIARFQVMASRKKIARDKLVFSTEATEIIANTFEAYDEAGQDRITDLQRCIEKLPPNSKRLIELKYGQSWAIDKIANEVERSYKAVTQALHRARLALMRCMEGGASDGR